jgi:transcriptional regulator with XRE-family HTH domain
MGGLLMNDRLRAARVRRGWSQNRLVYEIELYARQHALSVATTASLKVYVSEWENDKRAVSEPYTLVLRALFGMTSSELFERPTVTTAVDGYAELVTHIEAAHSISTSVVAVLLNQTELFRTLDRQMGASQLVDSMDRHITTLGDALTFAVLPSARTPVAEALAGAATLAAWQALDVGEADRAWRRYELAKQAAREAGQPQFLAHAMGEQAYVLADAGRADLATQLIDEALRISAVPARLKAWLLSARAELLALDGKPDECRRTLDIAAKVFPSDELLRDPDMPSIFLTEGHLTRWRGHALVLVGDNRAVADLYSAVESMDATFTRAQSGLYCDLAQAHLVRGEYDDAMRQLRIARTLANRTGSVRYLRRIDRLNGLLPS